MKRSKELRVIEAQQALEVLAGAGMVTRTGLVMPDVMTKERFLAIAQSVVMVSRMNPWWTADIAYWVMRHFKNQGEEVIMEMARCTGLGRKQLRLLAHTSKQFDLSERVDGLSLSHHKMVMHKSKAQRTYWLALALENQWSTRELIAWVTPPAKRQGAFVQKIPAPHMKVHAAFWGDYKRAAIGETVSLRKPCDVRVVEHKAVKGRRRNPPRLRGKTPSLQLDLTGSELIGDPIDQ